MMIVKKQNKELIQQKTLLIELIQQINKNIGKQLQTHQWITKLTEDQLQADKTYYTYGENFENSRLKKHKSNITVRKRKLYLLTSEERLKDLPSIYTEIPTDRAKKIEAAKEFFSNLIKQVPPESYKKFKIDYDEKNNINIMKQMKTTNQYNEINNRIQNLFRNLQKDPKSIFYSVSNLSRTLIFTMNQKIKTFIKRTII